MPSPFPGMDPYLEDPGLWPDFALPFLVAMRAELNRQLPKGLGALIQEDRLSGRFGKPHRFIRVHRVREEGVTTIVDLISPEQKVAGPARDACLAHREQRSERGLNWVDIDLTRSGERVLSGPRYPTSDYSITVTKAFEQSVYLWPVTLRDPLPKIPVPLHFPIPGAPLGLNRVDVMLDLQACFDVAYDEGRYSEWLGYNRPPKPPLMEPDATWARELLAARPNPE
jgi:hypothetical protein